VAAPRRRRPGAHARGHVLRSQPGVPAPGILELELEHPSDRYEILRHGGGGTPTTLICGAVRFDHPVARNLVGILLPLLYIQASDEPRASWMQAVFGLMAAEARAFRPGGEAVITRLADVLVIQAIRAWIGAASPRSPPSSTPRRPRTPTTPASRPRTGTPGPRPGRRSWSTPAATASRTPSRHWPRCCPTSCAMTATAGRLPQRPHLHRRRSGRPPGHGHQRQHHRRPHRPPHRPADRLPLPRPPPPARDHTMTDNRLQWSASTWLGGPLRCPERGRAIG
jgi:cupin